MKKKWKRLKNKIVLYIIILTIVIVFGLYLFSKYIRPKVIVLTQSYARNEISQVLDDEVKKVMLEEFFSYDKIVNISRDSENRVNSVSSNATLINRFTNDLGISVGDELDKRSHITHRIPVTNLIGFDLFSGIGPTIPISFHPISVTNADITHTFEEAGINQTLHTINLTVSVDMAIVVPMAHSTIRAESTMPIAQTLIVGTVPEAYLNKK